MKKTFSQPVTINRIQKPTSKESMKQPSDLSHKDQTKSAQRPQTLDKQKKGEVQTVRPVTFEKENRLKPNEKSIHKQALVPAPKDLVSEVKKEASLKKSQEQKAMGDTMMKTNNTQNLRNNLQQSDKISTPKPFGKNGTPADKTGNQILQQKEKQNNSVQKKSPVTTDLLNDKKSKK